MDSFSKLIKKENLGQTILSILFILYLIMGYKTPESIANVVDTMYGKIIIFLAVILMFCYANPILAVLGLFVAFTLIRSSSAATGINALKKYEPSEERKFSQFSAWNQFPYTLEQEVVSKMAPIVQSGSTLTKPSYKPMLDNFHDASPL